MSEKNGSRRSPRRWSGAICAALESRQLLTSGEFDPLFGAAGSGKQTLNFGADDTANAVAVQADGKIVVAGSWDGGASDFAIARYNPNGTLDTTFGGGVFGAGSGQSNVTFGLPTYGGEEFATGVAIDSSGRIVVVGYTNNVAGTAANGGNDIAVARLTSTGALDTSFSGDGKLTLDFGYDDRATAVAIQPADGKIVVAGFDDGGSSDFAALRINTDGTFDNTFGSLGRSTFTFGAADFATSLALQSDGKIILGGYTSVGSSGTDTNNFAVARLTTAGALDTTFNGSGEATLDFGGDDRAAAVGVDLYGSIVVAGKWDEGKSDFVVARYQSDGTLDTTFGSGFFGANSGKADVFFGATIGSNQDFCTGLSLRPDGTLVLSGYTDAATTSNDFAIAQLNYAGSLDTGFDGDGRKTIDFGGDDRALAIATTSDGSIIPVGITSASVGSGDFAIARLRGALDIGFGTVGQTTTNWGDTDTANAVAIQADGKLVVAGSWDGGASDFAVARYTAAGVLDATFGGGTKGAGSGMSNITFGLPTYGGAEFATDVAIDSLGRIVVVGYTNNVNGVAAVGANDFAIARLLPSGALDTTFNGTGKLTINFGADDRANSVVIRPDGRILVAGSWDGGQSEMAVASINPNGTLDTSFGGGFFGAGSGKTNVFFGAGISSGQDFCTDAVLLPNGKLVLAGYSNAANGSTSSSYDFAVARVNTDGSTDTTFGNAGKTLIDLGSTSEQANAIALQSDGKVVVVGYTASDFGVVRLTAAGLLDTSFAGGAGYEAIPWGITEVATDVVMQPDGKILIAGYTNAVDGTTNDAAVMRLNPNGSYDQTFSTAHNLPGGFDTGERLIVDFGGNSQGLEMALQANGQIVLAGTNDGNFAVARLTPVTSAGSATFEYETAHRVVVQMSSTTVGLTASDFVLQNLTTGTTVPSASISGAFSPDSSRLILTFPGFTNGILPDGNYRLTLPAGTYTDTAGNPNSTAFSSDFWFLNGDANRDRTVNFSDLVILAQNYTQTGRTFSQGNLDYSADGKVSFGDLVILAQRYGTTLAPPAITAADTWPLAGAAGRVEPKHGLSVAARLKELA